MLCGSENHICGILSPPRKQALVRLAYIVVIIYEARFAISLPSRPHHRNAERASRSPRAGRAASIAIVSDSRTTSKNSLCD